MDNEEIKELLEELNAPSEETEEILNELEDISTYYLDKIDSVKKSQLEKEE